MGLGAVLGLGKVAGGVNSAARTVLPGIGNKKKPAIGTAPPPSSLAFPGPTPPDAGLAASGAAVTAMQIAAKLRKKMRNNTGVVKPSSLATAAPPAPKSLIGY